jgi:hypothetical protein
MNTKKVESAITRWLFESEEKDSLELPEPNPIIPMDQAAAQLSRERPPVEDSEYLPKNSAELAAASHELGSQVPQSQIEFFYREISKLLEKSIEQNNTPDFQEILLGDRDIETPITVKENKKIKRKLKNRAARRRKGYITNTNKLNHGDLVRETRRYYKRDKASDKWKQGQPLELHRQDDNWDEYPDDEFVPDIDDLRDFMEANPDADPTKVPGYTEEMAKEFQLADILKTKAFPSVRGESGITNRLERDMYPILRATKNAKKLFDKLVDLKMSDFGIITYAESQYFGGLIGKETYEFIMSLTNDNLSKIKDRKLKAELKDYRKELVTSDEHYKYIVGETIVTPALKQLNKLAKQKDEKTGQPLYDPMSKKNQISDDQADKIIEKIRQRWNGMTKARKGNDAKKGAQSNLDFLSRDTSVMG